MSKRKDLLYACTKYDQPSLILGPGLSKAVEKVHDSCNAHPALIVSVRKGQDKRPKGNILPLGEIHLDRSKSASPIFHVRFDVENIDCELPRSKYQGQVHQVAWAQGPSKLDTRDVLNTIFCRLILLFADVLLVFTDEFPSSKDAFDVVLQWSRILAKVDTPWKPRLVMVSRKRLGTLDKDKLSSFDVARSLRLTQPHSEVLQQAIEKHIAAVHTYRRASQLSFSAKHLAAFFKAALTHVAQSLDSFDFIGETRKLNPIDTQISTNVQVFFKLSIENQMARQSIYYYVASALVMDSCPPGMHLFPAHTVFDALYAHHCFEAFAKLGFSPFESCKLLKAEYRKLYDSLEYPSAVLSHQQVLRNLTVDWNMLRTTYLCLFCIRRSEHCFQCGHALCDACVQRLGQKLKDREYAYQLRECPICLAKNTLIVDLKPPTAGARLLVLDGGGIRGIFSLLAIQALDTTRKLPYPIYDDFDLALGTSSGGLIVLMMFLRRTILECLSLFETFSNQVFFPRGQRNILSRLFAIVSSLVTDSRYGPTEIERCSREAYGSDTTLFNGLGHPSGRSATKFAVTAMSVSTSKLCILSTYNGKQNRHGYFHHRSSRTDDEVLVREAARATSAAPSYFPAKFVPGFGYLQDGGAGKHNNPIDPAEWETKAIWNVSSDVVVSIGTGYSQTPQASPTTGTRLQFRDRFFPRMFRIFGAMLNAQSSWDEHINRQKEQDRDKYFRINMPFENAPELDQSIEIPRLKRSSALFLEKFDFRPTMRALFAAAFFFELLDSPAVGTSNLTCFGTIRCRSPNSRAFCHRILDEYPGASFSTQDGETLGNMSNKSLCENCGLYNLDVSFNIHHCEQYISIYLTFNTLWKRKISGFPQSISAILQAQMIEADFGRANHGKLCVKACSCFNKRKRLFSTPTARKRMCNAL